MINSLKWLLIYLTIYNKEYTEEQISDILDNIIAETRSMES